MRVGCYVRVSSQEQLQHGHSLEEQTDRLRKYCAAMDWDVYRVYTDGGWSGGNTDRPALQRLIRDVETRKIDKVLVYKLDRLSRSQKDTLYLIEDVFLANHVDFVSMSENFDTATPFGRAMIGILAVFAQLEREQIKERMGMGRAARAKKGLFHGSGKCAIGYRYEHGELIVDDFEAMQVRRIYQEYISGKSPQAIAKDLNDGGFYHQYGQWSAQAVRYVLTKKTYIGLIEQAGEIHQGKHQAIIDQETFDKAQAIMDRKRTEHEIHNRRLGLASTYLGGFLVCGCCGAKYSKRTYSRTYHGKEYTYNLYTCNSRNKKNKRLIKDPNCKNRSWRIEVLDDLVFGEIRKLALDPSFTGHRNEEPDDTPIRAEIEKITDQINRLMDLYMDEKIPADLLQDRIHQLSEKKSGLEDQLMQKAAGKLTQDETIEIVRSFGDVLDGGDYDQIRTIIESLIDHIVLTDDIEIHWNFT